MKDLTHRAAEFLMTASSTVSLAQASDIATSKITWLVLVTIDERLKPRETYNHSIVVVSCPGTKQTCHYPTRACGGVREGDRANHVRFVHTSGSTSMTELGLAEFTVITLASHTVAPH